MYTGFKASLARASVGQAVTQSAQFWQRAGSILPPSSVSARASCGQASAHRLHAL